MSYGNTLVQIAYESVYGRTPTLEFLNTMQNHGHLGRSK